MSRSNSRSARPAKKRLTARVTGARNTGALAAPGWLQLAVGVLIPLDAELALHLLYDPAAHVFAQREAEVHGWLSMAALLALLATRPLRFLTPYRKALGLAGFAYALLHVWFSYQYVLGGDWENLLFFSLGNQAGLWTGIVATLGLLPLALTSTRGAQRALGRHWKTLHQLSPYAALLAALHTAWVGVHFGLSPLTFSSVVLLALSGALFALRFRKVKT